MYKKISTYIAVIGIFILFTPVLVQANYTYNDKTFDSFEKMQEYIVAYMEAWREVYGEKEVDPKSSYVLSRTKNKLEVDTTFARDVTYSSARFVGELELNDSDRARVWFDYGLHPTRLTMRTNTEIIGELYGLDSFDQKAINLYPETTYYYRAGAIDESGHVRYGDVKRFTTSIDTEHSDALISVRTNYPNNIDDTHAILRGYVNYNKEQFAYVWFQYGDHEDDLYKKTPVQTVYKDRDRYVTATIQRLDDDQKYFYRFIGMDRFGEASYGKINTFTTRKDIKNEAPEAKTQRAIETTPYSATLTGHVDMNDFRDGVVFFIYGEDRKNVAEVAQEYDEYGDIREKGDDRQKVLLDDNLDRFSTYEKTIAYLNPSTTYYFAIGVAYEDENGDEVIALGRTSTLRTKRDTR